MLLVTINEWGSTVSIQFFFSKASIILPYLWQSHNGSAFWTSGIQIPFVHSHWWHFDKHISFSAPPLPLSPPPSLLHTHTHVHTRSHYRCHGGDGGHLIVVCPGLQVLQGVEGGVVQAERVRLQGLAQRLLESFLLKLQHQPVGLLPLGLSLLRSLSPGWTGETKGEQRKI